MIVEACSVPVVISIPNLPDEWHAVIRPGPRTSPCLDSQQFPFIFHQASRWVQEHKTHFRGRVYGPIICEVEVNNQLHASMLEQHVPSTPANCLAPSLCLHTRWQHATADRSGFRELSAVSIVTIRCMVLRLDDSARRRSIEAVNGRG